MDRTCTPNSLVKFMYHETSAAESQMVREAMEDDLLLREEFSRLQWAYRQLPKVRFNAPPKALQAVLQYSRLALENQF
ncbi:MAG: hypothetical protein ACOYOD_04885 [Saprospiraceae bacterium]